MELTVSGSLFAPDRSGHSICPCCFELTLFCNGYDDNQRHLSPLYVRNNVNGVGNRDSEQVNSLRNGGVLNHQEWGPPLDAGISARPLRPAAARPSPGFAPRRIDDTRR
jgi:hypothetical protein